jgi:threonine/homoserine/homoserine lactone efflux protein
MDEKAILDHQFTVAAYVVVWAVQLAYLGWLALKWRAQKRIAARKSRPNQGPSESVRTR